MGLNLETQDPMLLLLGTLHKIVVQLLLYLQLQLSMIFLLSHSLVRCLFRIADGYALRKRRYIFRAEDKEELVVYYMYEE